LGRFLTGGTVRAITTSDSPVAIPLSCANKSGKKPTNRYPLESKPKDNQITNEVTSNMSAKNYWLAFGIGVTAGAAIALLYAPQTGVKTRKQLRKGVEDAGDYLEDAANYLKEQAERLSKEAEKAVKRTKGHVDNVVDKANDAVQSAVKSAQSLV
jgi:gas vesicle protein